MKSTKHQWRCKGCGNLLGILDGNRIEIRFARGHQYLVGFPVTCVCRDPRCNTLNEICDPQAVIESAFNAEEKR